MDLSGHNVPREPAIKYAVSLQLSLNVMSIRNYNPVYSMLNVKEMVITAVCSKLLGETVYASIPICTSGSLLHVPIFWLIGTLSLGIGINTASFLSGNQFTHHLLPMCPFYH